MEDIETKNALITDVQIEIEDHGILTLLVRLDYGGVMQAFGGFDVRTNLSKWMIKLFDVLEVRDFDSIKGKTVRVKCSRTEVYSIGHFMKDKWFTPKKDLK